MGPEENGLKNKELEGEVVEESRSDVSEFANTGSWPLETKKRTWLLALIFIAWHVALRKMKAAKNKWAYATGPISATIAMLLDIDINPMHPILWRVPAHLRDGANPESQEPKEYQLLPKHDTHAHHRVRSPE